MFDVDLDIVYATAGTLNMADLARAAQLMRQRVLNRLMEGGVTLVDPAHTYVDAGVSIGADTLIEPGCVITGATVLGPPPSRSPSLQNYPACDEAVRSLAAEIWGGVDVADSGERRVGSGRVFFGKSLSELFNADAEHPLLAESPAGEDDRHAVGREGVPRRRRPAAPPSCGSA